MRLSARNQLSATITAIELGAVMATVTAVLGDGQVTVAAITKDAVESLGLAVGDAVTLVIKSTEIMVGKD